MDIEEVSAGRKNVILMDNNVLASDYGLQQIEKIVSMGVRVDFNQLRCSLGNRRHRPAIGKSKVDEAHTVRL